MESDNTLSNGAFIVNFINMCIGIGLLVKPYAISIAGSYSILSVCMAFAFITYAGYLLAKTTINHINEQTINYEMVNIISSDEQDDDESIIIENKRVESSNKTIFQILGYKAFGKYGEYYINIALPLCLVLYFIQILIMQFELCSRIIEFLFATKPIPFYLKDTFIFIYMFIITMPFIFTSNWKQLTFVGLISVISIITITLTVFILYILSISVMKFDGNSVPSDYNTHNDAIYAIENISMPARIFLSFIIFKGGICGALGIPPMIISLKNRSTKNVNVLIFISYFIVMAFSLLFGIIGAQLYPNVNVLILNNLFIWPSGVIVVIITFIKIINLWSTYGIYAQILYGIIENLLDIDASTNISSVKGNIKKYLVRSCFQILIFFIAYFFRYDLAFVTTVGQTFYTSFTGALMLPLLLYIGIFYNRMKIIEKVFHIMLLVVIVGIAVTVLISSKHLV
eukprot:319714_1